MGSKDGFHLMWPFLNIHVAIQEDVRRQVCDDLVSLVEEMDLTNLTKQRLLAGTALEWLGLTESEYIRN